jgi:hypothetical protein
MSGIEGGDFWDVGETLITTAERSNDRADWNVVQEECNNGIFALDDIQKKLKETP